tara:strand:+ start:1980 stop:2471 length:492 start_codon:yes stop_codon:yes gene_type:complete
MIVDLDVNYSDRRWHRFDFIKYMKLLFKADILLSKIKTREVAVSLLACNNNEIKELNYAFLGKNKSTNVLAWPTKHLATSYELVKSDNGFTKRAVLGDIAISFDYCLKESKASKKSFDEHCCHLLVHAVLHLIGYNHETGNEASKMQKMENRILSNMGICNIY